MKKIIIFLACLFSSSCFACNKVDPWPSTDPRFDTKVFCYQFEQAALCHCQQSFPEKYCRTIGMKGIYDKMIQIYHSVENACHVNPGEVDEDTCKQQWNFFLKNCHM